MTHMTVWSYCCKLTPFVANMSLFCTSMKNKHQPETWAYLLKSGTINILKSDRAESSRAQFAKLWEPALPASLSVFPLSQKPAPPSFTSPQQACAMQLLLLGKVSSHTSKQPGALIRWQSILKTKPCTHPPYSLSLKLQPNGWETLNCKPQWTEQQQQTTSLHQHTKLDFLFSTLQNSYWKRNLLPIDQHGYKCWACFCLVNILPS